MKMFAEYPCRLTISELMAASGLSLITGALFFFRAHDLWCRPDVQSWTRAREVPGKAQRTNTLRAVVSDSADCRAGLSDNLRQPTSPGDGLPVTLAQPQINAAAWLRRAGTFLET